MIAKLIKTKDLKQNLISYERKFVLEKLKKEVKKAREQVKRGEVYSHEEIMRKYGLL